MSRLRRWWGETFRLNYLLGAHSPSLFWRGRCRCLSCRRAARKARGRRQCRGAVYSHQANPPERCAYELDHEGECQP